LIPAHSRPTTATEEVYCFVMPTIRLILCNVLRLRRFQLFVPDRGIVQGAATHDLSDDLFSDL
jgi:hypothetical protein